MLVLPHRLQIISRIEKLCQNHRNMWINKLEFFAHTVIFHHVFTNDKWPSDLHCNCVVFHLKCVIISVSQLCFQLPPGLAASCLSWCWRQHGNTILMFGRVPLYSEDLDPSLIRIWSTCGRCHSLIRDGNLFNKTASLSVTLCRRNP